MTRINKPRLELDERRLLKELLAWKPNAEWKKKFLDSDVYMTFLIAARGAGKTATYCRKALIYALSNPGAVIILAAPVNNQIESVVLKTFRNVCPTSIWEWCVNTGLYNATYRRLTLPNDSIIYFRSAENYDSFRGMECSFVAIDEARDMARRDAFDVLTTVLRQPGGYKYQMVVASTPSSKIKWIKDDYIKNHPKETTWEDTIKDDFGNEYTLDYIWFTGTSMENTALDPGYLARLKQTYGEGILFRQEAYAEWVDLTGTCFNIGENNITELFTKYDDNSGIKDLKIPIDIKNVEIVYLHDWGRVSPIVVMLYDRRGDVFYIIDEVYMEDKGTSEIISEARRLQWLYGIGVHPGDPSHSTDMKELELNGFNVVKAEKRDVVGRINDINELLRSGKMIIDSNKCPNTIREMTNLMWDDNKLRGNTIGEDHCVDAIGYGVKYFKTMNINRFRNIYYIGGY